MRISKLSTCLGFVAVSILLAAPVNADTLHAETMGPGASGGTNSSRMNEFIDNNEIDKNLDKFRLKESPENSGTISPADSINGGDIATSTK